MKIYRVVVCIVLTCILYGCSKSEVGVLYENKDEVDIVIATDVHYISKNLVEEGENLDRIHYNGDGKIVKYIEEITDAFVNDIIKMQPEVLIISGDLTFNGARESHEEFAKKLSKIKESGVTVLVTAGNHDINNYYAAKINSDNIENVDRVNPKEFKEIYSNLGYDVAAYQDKNSLSYITKVTEDLWIFMIDSNIYNNNSRINPSEPSGEISNKTLKWIEKYLELAKKEGAEVITVTHHNLVDHNSMMNFNFTINNNEELIDLLDKYGVKLNLSGHIHIQDIKEVQGENSAITDIATSALSVYDNQYGIIKYTPKKEMFYTTKEVDIELWARENHIEDENLLNFEEYSNEFFKGSSKRQAIQSLSGYSIGKEDLDILSDFVGKINPSYFSGTLHKVYDELIASEGYRLWEEVGDISMKPYIDSILNGEIKDQNTIIIDLN